MSKEIKATWYTPEEKLPPEGLLVVATISGSDGWHKHFTNCFAIGEFYKDGGWFFDDIDTDKEGAWVTVHAWCDLVLYEG